MDQKELRRLYAIKPYTRPWVKAKAENPNAMQIVEDYRERRYAFENRGVHKHVSFSFICALANDHRALFGEYDEKLEEARAFAQNHGWV